MQNDHQQQVRTLAERVMKEAAAHGIPLEFVAVEDQPIMGRGRRHVELVFDGRCDKQRFEKAAAAFDENIAGLPLVHQKLRHNDRGEFDPSLGFTWKLYAELE